MEGESKEFEFITGTELEKVQKFLNEHQHPELKRGAAGGTITWEYIGTSIGTVIKICCACWISQDVTDYDQW